jgi:phosphonate transport system substrate-binding protein
MALRLVTYLAPSIPMGFFLAVADQLAAALGRPVALRSLGGSSGPAPGLYDPFAAGDADVGFVCASSLVWLEAQASARLLGVAPVHRDARNGGRPLYFAELVVAAEREVERLEDLRGARCCFNDEVSLSGHFSVIDRLARMGETRSFFSKMEASGSHLASLRRVVAGQADVAAIDSTVLSMARARLPELGGRLRVLETLGPFAVHPVVVRSAIPAPLRATMGAALAGMHETAAGREVLALHGIERFAPVEPAHYQDVRDRIRAHSGWPLDGQVPADVL